MAYFKYSLHKLFLTCQIYFISFTNTLRRAWDKTRGEEHVIFLNLLRYIRTNLYRDTIDLEKNRKHETWLVQCIRSFKWEVL